MLPFKQLIGLLVGGMLMVMPVLAAAKTESIVLGMGCFWGAEKRMSEIAGVLDVESGYAGGDAVKTSYAEVLNVEKALRQGTDKQRNHAEVIKVTFDPDKVNLRTVLIKFWESHDPTQGDQQGNDKGSNYRSVIYYTDDTQKELALETRDIYQQALSKAGRGTITTEIALLRNYNAAEDYHQDYLKKNPNGYCGLGGTGVVFPGSGAKAGAEPLEAAKLNLERQLISFEAEDCPFCKRFHAEVLDGWKASTPIASSINANPPQGWTLEKAVFATPTIVLFEKGKEVSRYTGYNGEKERFWKWLGFQLLTPEQQKIAFEQGTERAFTGSNLDEKRPGTFVDPITGAALFRSDSKFNSGTGWPSFFNPIEGSITLHEDNDHGMKRVEVRSSTSGIHLGHVFDDGPKPSGKRYCINGNVLKFVPDEK
jgi:peptide methionine sulfoxide reductase msrA/msrB